LSIPKPHLDFEALTNTRDAAHDSYSRAATIVRERLLKLEEVLRETHPAGYERERDRREASLGWRCTPRRWRSAS
jgi:hypothetical protein